MFAKFTRKAAVGKNNNEKEETTRRGQMKFTDMLLKSEHVYGKCNYAPLVYSTRPGKTRQVQAFCPFSHDGVRKGLEFSDDVMLKCSVHGLHIPSGLVTLSEKQDKTIQVYDADSYDVDRMTNVEKEKWMKDFESAHGRKPTNIYSYEKNNMLLPRCNSCRTLKIGRSNTEQSRGRYFFSCVGCGIKKQDFYCYYLNITKKDVKDLLDKVDRNPGDYDNIIKVEHIQRFLKELFTSSAPSDLTVRLYDSQDITLEDMDEDVLDTSSALASEGVSEVSENALLFVKSFFNFENYIIITIKYFHQILEAIKEKNAAEKDKSVSSNNHKYNDENSATTSKSRVEDLDSVEVVPNKRIKRM